MVRGTPLLISISLQLACSPGTPCDSFGRDLPPGAMPPSSDTANVGLDFYPFNSVAEFNLAEFLYRRNQTPAVQIDQLMDIWASNNPETGPPFADHKELYDIIDSIELGDAPWKSFAVSYSGDLPCDEETEIPPWMTAEYEVWYCDPLAVLENQLANPAFNGNFHMAAYREHQQTPVETTEIYGNYGVLHSSYSVCSSHRKGTISVQYLCSTS